MKDIIPLYNISHSKNCVCTQCEDDLNKKYGREYEKNGSKSSQIWHGSTYVGSNKHPYLVRKKVKSFGLRTISVSQLNSQLEKEGVYVRGENYKKFIKGEDSLLVVPLQDIDGTLQSLQFINSKGVKMLLMELLDDA